MNATEPTGCAECDSLQDQTHCRVDLCVRCAQDLARYNQKLRRRRLRSINDGIHTEEITERIDT